MHDHHGHHQHDQDQQREQQQAGRPARQPLPAGLDHIAFRPGLVGHELIIALDGTAALSHGRGHPPTRFASPSGNWRGPARRAAEHRRQAPRKRSRL
jgi:hypothetical protein